MAYRQPWSLVGPKHNDQYTGGHTGVTTEDVVRAVLPAGTFTCRGLTYHVYIWKYFQLNVFRESIAETILEYTMSCNLN